MSQPSRFRGLALLADFLVRYRIGLFIAGAVISAFAFVEATKLTLEQSIESLYALDDPHLVDYRQSKSLFGGDEFVIVVYEDPDSALRPTAWPACGPLRRN